MKHCTNLLGRAGISARGAALVAASTLILGACGGSAMSSAIPAAGQAPSKPASANSPVMPQSANSRPASLSPASSLAVAPAQLPAFKAESWVAQAPGRLLTVTGHDIGLNECARVDGATTWQQQGYESSGGDPAILETYTFTSTRAAAAAYTGVLVGMDHCQSISRALQTANHIPADAVCTETAHTRNAEAFERTWIGVQGISAAGPQINHLYIAISGSTIVVLHFDQLNTRSSSARTYSVHNDPAVLTMLTNLLAAHAGGS